MLRHTLAKEIDPWTADRPDAARICVTAGAAGPVGGDRFRLDVEVGAGSTLVLGEISPTLLLPGPHGEQSRMATVVHVAEGATLVWLAEPLIAARDCHHLNDVRVDLEPGARLLLREELLLGRYGEQPGTVRQRTRVRLGGRPLYHQDLHIGPAAPAWNSPSVVGDHTALGSVLLVDPAFDERRLRTRIQAAGAAALPLAGPAVVLTVLAHDALSLRRQLACGLSETATPTVPHPAPSKEDSHA